MTPLRFALAATTLLLLPLPALLPTTALAQPGGQARIDQAVRAYAAKQQADTEKDHDQRVVANANALLADPASPVIGNPAAQTAVIEFFDYACPYCKAVEPRLEGSLRADRTVKLILKEFPILTPASMVATRAALASVAQGKYTPFHQALMNYRGQLDDEAIFGTAKSLGIDVTRLKKDMNDPAISGEIIANFNLARALRQFQTPAFIVGNHVLTGQSADTNFPKEIALARGH